MRLLFLIHTVDPRAGGPAATLRQLIPELLKRGHEVEVCALDAPVTPTADYPCALHLLGSATASGGYGWNSRLIPWLHKHVERFDHVVVRGIWQWIGAACLIVCARRGVPYSVFVHGMLDPWFKQRYPLKHLKKQLYWLLIEHWVLRKAHAVLFTTEEERATAGESFLPYKCNEQVIRYGIADCPYSAREVSEAFAQRFPQLAERRFVLFLGRLHEKKGIDLLLKGFAATSAGGLLLPELVIAGPVEDEPYFDSLRQLASKLGIASQVHWLGMLEGAVKWGALSAAEAFVLVSHQENFGVAAVEALSCATPVLLSRDVAISSLVAAAGAGLVGPTSVAGSSQLLQQFITLSAEEQRQMAAHAQTLFSSHFSISAAAESLITVLQGEPTA